MQNIQDQALKIMNITQGNICNRCLGRNFYPQVSGNDNEERGIYIRKMLASTQVSEKENLYEKNDTCHVCGDIFLDLEDTLKNIINEIDKSKIEFSTFLVGCRLPNEILEKEEILHDTIGFEGENIKKEINRELGKELSLQLDKEVEFDNPNLVVMMDFSQDKVELQINPLFLEGRYRKLIRGIPQTRWPCRNCKGKGCKRCDFTGKMYPESVEELIAERVLFATQGNESKFHGAGREDIDVRMLGRGRPFVLEIKEPKVRSLDLEELSDEINNYGRGKVEILDLKSVGKERRSGIKSSSTETCKTYLALVEVDGKVSEEDLNILNSLKLIKQRTPIRVSHRRADKVRSREVKEIEVKLLDSNHFELIVNCEGGLYIKELISGDEERTQPSVTSLLGIAAKCSQLDVLEVNI
ncbi:tRNA pseudouridine(54/55) synthase Pus10 [Methanobacterium ferruginis]|uniref:tRNA pseudouridine(54/55) synthase Pus10 n=1 Tax=Methanobacterium ferruginis TaxID=710191 RepID=UPI0025740635|nr:tRNA pseudouridine(54/55) synthase Pus10 [Methanobacterium ferruginis]BDZ67138.1 tRNA pseudouridine(54/55) synthase Pus10 [Methanobacterium ferruginis]